MDKPACVYLLRCADDTLYTGWTHDVGGRLKAHNDGVASKYTRSRLPVTLVYCEALPSRCDALRREAEIKKLSRKQKLALIQLKNEECGMKNQQPDVQF